jgi:hypothetical protein
MNTQQVAERLVELCRQGDFLKAGQELHADNVVSIEPAHSPMPTANGKKAVTEKGNQFAQSIETRHDGSLSDPVVGGNHFSVSMMLDATFKGKGRMKLDEVCVYEVKDGKIVKEQFFF